MNNQPVFIPHSAFRNQKMSDNKQSTQFRFLLAATLSLGVLFAWTYFFPSKKPEQTNSNTAQVVADNSPAPEAATTQTAQQPVVVAASVSDNTPNRQITIQTPLYKVTLDSKGAMAKSWVLLKNQSKQGEYAVFADGSTEANPKPLELISEEARKRGDVPFRLSTGDQNLDAVLNDRNYQTSATEDLITLGAGQEMPVSFTLTDGSGVEVTKNFVFRADNYVSDLSVKVTRNGQIVPNTKLLIGASIGDHAINHHNFYQIESEAVAAVSGDIVRHQGNYAFTFDANNQSSLPVNGAVDWAGVGDAYFAMAAIPATQTQGLEYRASKYEVQTQPYFDGIFSWITRSEKTSEMRHLVTAHVPINADGSVTKIYTGTKDYFALNDYNDVLTKSVGREISLENLINFSNYAPVRWFVKPLSIPILRALTFINNFTHNYGWAIIIFTFLFYSLLFPLRWSQSRSFKKASGNAPKMKELQDKLKDFQKKGIPADDPRMRELQVEQLKMMKTAVPLGGCLPMLLQFPLLIAFYTAVTISLSIRQATFLWLPDLSAGDPWHVLEFAFAISMVLSMKFTPQAATITPEQQMQQKMMIYLMPVMMLWIMWAAPAGLLLYWFFGNVVSFGQQMIINRMNKTDEPPKEEIVESVPKNAKKIKPKLSTS